MPDTQISDDATATLATTTILPVVTVGASNVNEKTTLAALKSALGYGGVIELFPATCRFSNIADSTAIHTTTAETAFSVTYTIPASLLTAGASIRIVAAGKHSTTGTPTLTFKVKLAGTVVADGAALTCGSGVTDRCWRAEGAAVVRATGASGTVVRGGGLFDVGGAPTGSLTSGTFSLDTTTTNVVSVTATWSASSSSNTITLQTLRVWIEQPGATS